MRARSYLGMSGILWFLLIALVLGGCGQVNRDIPTLAPPLETASTGTGIYEHLATWGSLGSGDSQFWNPEGIAVDSKNSKSGAVYVADTVNSRIQKFDSSGTFLTTWGSFGSGDGQFGHLSGVAVDSLGDVYVTDIRNHRIQKFSSSGEFLAKWGSLGSGNGQFNQPAGVAVDGSDDVYVTDYDNHRIQKFSSSGTFLTTWGSKGSGNGQFLHPAGVAVDSSGNVYVADTYNSRIQKFDSNGNFLTTWGSFGSGDVQFGYLWGVAVDSSGNVYVADTGYNRIQKFSSSGTFLTTWGSEGSGNGQFKVPHSVALDSSGNVYVTEIENHRIQKFSPSGTFFTIWESFGSGDDQFRSPRGLAVDRTNNISSGNVYVADTWNHRIQKFNQKSNSGGTFLDQVHPYGVAVDSSGNVYVADTGYSRIQKFSSSGTFLTTWGSRGSGNGQFDLPVGIAVDRHDNVYVVDTGNSRIQKFDSTGTFLTKWGSRGSGNGQFDFPEGIAVDSSDNVYVADTGNNRIQKFSSSGTFLTTWGSLGLGDGQFYQPAGIAVDSSGNVYVADTDNHHIKKFDTNGTFLTKWGIYGSGNGQFKYPHGVAVDSSGNVYVADTENNRIQMFGNTTATAPDTNTIITSAPPHPSSSNSASFAFTGSDNLTDPENLIFECRLDGSGFSSCTSPKSYTGLADGKHTFEVRAINQAGNVDPSPASHTWTIDTLAPTVTINQADSQADPTADSPILFSAVFSEPVSGFDGSKVSLSGTAGATTAVVSGGPTTYSVAVSGMTTSGTVIVSIPANAVTDAAGNGNTASTSTDNTVTFRADSADTTPPVITPDIQGTLGTNGWYTSDVMVSWTITDDESSVSSKEGCDQTIISTDTTGTSLTCTATSAGGTSSNSVTIRRDATPPTITLGFRTAANEYGWNNTFVFVSWYCADDTSGVDGDMGAMIDEGRDQSATGFCTDLAGNTASDTQTGINVDKTPPSAPQLSLDKDVDYTDGTTSWFKDGVTVSYHNSSDPALADGSEGSGVIAHSAAETFSTSGASTYSGTASDTAGNVSEATTGTVNVDADLPQVSITCPSEPLSVGSTAGASWTAFDAHSGLATPASGTVTLDTGSAGEKTATAPQAVDNVGYTSAMATCTYTVVEAAVTITLGLDATGTLNSKAGVATVSGTVTCSAPASVNLGVTLSQTQGKKTIAGSNKVSVSCNGTTPWSTQVSGKGGSFTTGSASAGAEVIGSDPLNRVTRNITIVEATGTITLGLDATGTVNRKTGVATVSGTVTCSAPESVNLNVTLSQKQGKTTITTIAGSKKVSVSCNGTTPWSTQVSSKEGKFTTGPASAGAEVIGSEPLNQVTRIIDLQ